MAIVPPSRLGQIEFFEAHIAGWQTNVVALGLTPAPLTALSNLIVAARSAYNASVIARDEAKSSTQTMYNGVDAMHNAGADVLRVIKNTAETTNNPNIYTLANIPPPAPPSPAPPPDAPTLAAASLENNGSITISWYVTRPAPGAAVYTTILRQLNGAGAFVPLGDTGDKQFNDPSVPPGTPKVTYLLQARRAGPAGGTSPFSEPLTVFLGVPQEGGGDQQLQLAA